MGEEMEYKQKEKSEGSKGTVWGNIHVRTLLGNREPQGSKSSTEREMKGEMRISSKENEAMCKITIKNYIGIWSFMIHNIHINE